MGGGKTDAERGRGTHVTGIEVEVDQVGQIVGTKTKTCVRACVCARERVCTCVCTREVGTQFRHNMPRLQKSVSRNCGKRWFATLDANVKDADTTPSTKIWSLLERCPSNRR